MKIEHKKCSKCHIIKHFSCFQRHPKCRFGINSRCKQCRNLQNRNFYYKNKQKIRAKQKIYEEFKRKNDYLFRIKRNLRRRILASLKGENKSYKTLILLGCSIEKFKNYLQSKFQEGMSWANYGRTGWHIDHIRPCVSFDLSNSKQQKQCFHYTNMQPLWWRDNIKKGAKF